MSDETPYTPVDCEFHDVLEATATRRQAAAIHFTDHSGEPVSVRARIVDLYSEDKVEYMRLDTGGTIRLDRIISVDGILQAAFGEASAVRPG